MPSKDKTSAAVAGGCSTLIIFAVGVTFIHAWFISTFWGWFVTPLTHTTIGLAHALGLSCIVSVFRTSSTSKSEKSDDEWYVPLLQVVIQYAIIYGTACLAHNYMH